MTRPENSPADLRVVTCETAEALLAATALFDRYRRHYGQRPDDAGALGWLTEMVARGTLTVYLATSGSSRPLGVATTHAIPASLALAEFWHMRDLYVDPEARRRGVAAALVDAVSEAARAAGATRLSLVTEQDNQAALGLYRRLGFEVVEGLTTLSLDLTARS